VRSDVNPRFEPMIVREEQVRMLYRFRSADWCCDHARLQPDRGEVTLSNGCGEVHGCFNGGLPDGKAGPWHQHSASAFSTSLGIPFLLRYFSRAGGAATRLKLTPNGWGGIFSRRHTDKNE